MDKKLIIQVFSALIVNAIVGALVASLLGLGAMGGAVVACLIAIALGGFMPKGAAHAGVLTEVWTGELIKSLRGKMEGTWLDGVPDQSSIAQNNVIHLVNVGADPKVLVNNTTYPLTVQALADGDKTFTLNKFQSQPTPITDDELYACSYDKMGRVRESHTNAINDKKFAMAAHALCANSNTAKTPVLKTTGAKDGTRLKMTLADVIAMKKAMDKLGVPATDRRLVLCPDHVNDLLASEQSFREQYNINRQDGSIGRLYGFDIYEYANNPTYSTAGAKNAVDKTPGTGEYQCSFAFYVPRVFKATGTTKMYYSTAETDPLNQRNLISYRHYFICMPKKEDAGVVMMSAYQAS